MQIVQVVNSHKAYAPGVIKRVILEIMSQTFHGITILKSVR